MDISRQELTYKHLVLFYINLISNVRDTNGFEWSWFQQKQRMSRISASIFVVFFLSAEIRGLAFSVLARIFSRQAIGFFGRGAEWRKASNITEQQKSVLRAEFEPTSIEWQAKIFCSLCHAAHWFTHKV